jgi:uncharacterized protein involved in exopolysaccharide biosynthesis
VSCEGALRTISLRSLLTLIPVNVRYADVSSDDELSIADIVRAFKRRARLIASVTALSTTIGVLYAIFAPPLYTATVVAVVADTEDRGLSSVMGGLASAAALAGVSLAGGDSNRQAYLATLRSQQLADKFITENGLLPYLFAERWDADKKAWQRKPAIIPMAGNSQRNEPSSWQAYQVFKKIRHIEEDATAGVITISFRFSDPRLAAEWANNYVALANSEIRDRTVKESSQALDYLRQQAESTNILGIRETIYRLVESHLEKIALAKARQEFAFRVIDRAVPPEERSHPKRKIVVALSLLVGIFMGGFLTLILESYADRLHAGRAQSVS